MASTLRNLIKKILPEKLRPYIQAENWLFARSSGAVMSGPFKGLKYVPGSVGSAFFPKIVGTYEIELEQIVGALIGRNFETIVNVGAGEGYYAAGFAVKCPSSRVLAFEADANGQKLVGEIGKINNVDGRIEVNGFCDPEGFRAALLRGSPGSPLVIMDIEGGEKLLLDPEKFPELKTSHVLVELHDFAYRDIAEIMTDRFDKTHEITEIWSRQREIEDFPARLPFLFRTVFRTHFLYFMDEGRPERMRWYYLKPLAEKTN